MIYGLIPHFDVYLKREIVKKGEIVFNSGEELRRGISELPVSRARFSSQLRFGRKRQSGKSPFPPPPPAYSFIGMGGGKEPTVPFSLIENRASKQKKYLKKEEEESQ